MNSDSRPEPPIRVRLVVFREGREPTRTTAKSQVGGIQGGQSGEWCEH